MITLRRMLLPATIALLAAALPAAASAAGRSVHISGTAYEFNNVKVKLAGATIKVAEVPSATTTVKADGSYRLTVPGHRTVTPYIVAAGYHTVYLQTFRTDGADLEHVNFQTPTDAVAMGLAAIVGVPFGPDNYPEQCVIVSTFSTRNVRGLGVSFDDFTAYGAHGVAGAIASASPALPAPIYFNDKVVPDRSQKRSSVDGGVIWTGVPAGVYTIRATKPGTRFASFTATCENGRIVNANPPWGLHELGKKSPVVVRPRWSGARLVSLRVSRLPNKAVVSFAGRSQKVLGSSVDVAGWLPAARSTLKRGRTLELQVTAPAYDGTVVRWRLGSSRRPVQTKLCLPLGDTAARKRC